MPLACGSGRPRSDLRPHHLFHGVAKKPVGRGFRRDAENSTQACAPQISRPTVEPTSGIGRAPVKLESSWVEVPPVELDGSRPKRSVRDEAVRPNRKRDRERNGRVATKVNLIE
jgi:hypothetical protein